LVKLKILNRKRCGYVKYLEDSERGWGGVERGLWRNLEGAPGYSEVAGQVVDVTSYRSAWNFYTPLRH